LFHAVASAAPSSDCGELNGLAVEWIDSIDAELGRHLTASTLAEFQYQTNLTEYNERQVTIFTYNIFKKKTAKISMH